MFEINVRSQAQQPSINILNDQITKIPEETLNCEHHISMSVH